MSTELIEMQQEEIRNLKRRLRDTTKDLRATNKELKAARAVVSYFRLEARRPAPACLVEYDEVYYEGMRLKR